MKRLIKRNLKTSGIFQFKGKRKSTFMSLGFSTVLKGPGHSTIQQDQDYILVVGLTNDHAVLGVPTLSVHETLFHCPIVKQKLLQCKGTRLKTSWSRKTFAPVPSGHLSWYQPRQELRANTTKGKRQKLQQKDHQ